VKTFSDGKNQWAIEINVGSIKRVLGDTGINLSLPHDPDADGKTLAERLVFDVIVLVDVIWSLVKPQAESMSVTVDQFLEAMKPELMLAAGEAFHGEWIDFFQKMNSPVQAKIIQQAKELRAELQTKGVIQVDRVNSAKRDFITNQMEREVDAALAEMDRLNNPTVIVSSGSVTDSAASSGPSTLTEPPGDSSVGLPTRDVDLPGKSRRT
jgi:hypothetical protein